MYILCWSPRPYTIPRTIHSHISDFCVLSKSYEYFDKIVYTSFISLYGIMFVYVDWGVPDHIISSLCSVGMYEWFSGDEKS
jgi:hypothetical protein